MRLFFILLIILFTTPIAAAAESGHTETSALSLEQANTLLELPLACVETEYPNKLNQVIGSHEHLQSPRQLHPIFYGCFDWHSAVHGYWSMVTLLTQFPQMNRAEEAKAILLKNITPKLVQQELAYFQADINKGWERTYGWAWLLKLSQALSEWQDPMGPRLAMTLEPLTQHIVNQYQAFLPKLVYPIRVGEHTNTAFGLTFAYDYAIAANKPTLKRLIEQRANDFYADDQRCPISWEPSGYDFLSPCLEEVDLMRRVLPAKEFKRWLRRFMPELKKRNYQLAVGKVGDRSDGKLVHLDGLNFSRAWVLYGLANEYPRYAHLRKVADSHMQYSYPNLVGDGYEGGHWLASFAIYALNQAK